ncbi:MAG: hypothetical protein ACWA5P_06985 [bacterium]
MKLLNKVIVASILILTIGCQQDQKTFNSDEWKNWVESEATPNTRWLMHRDLIRNYELEGVSKDSIIQLLGKPNSQTNLKFYYQLGNTGKGINMGTLIIIFEDDSVEEIEVTNG